MIALYNRDASVYMLPKKWNLHASCMNTEYASPFHHAQNLSPYNMYYIVHCHEGEHKIQVSIVIKEQWSTYDEL